MHPAAGNTTVRTPGDARVCTGDSGGPAIKEGSTPAAWGIDRSFSSNTVSTLVNPNPAYASASATIQFTSTSANMRVAWGRGSASRARASRSKVSRLLSAGEPYGLPQRYGAALTFRQQAGSSVGPPS